LTNDLDLFPTISGLIPNYGKCMSLIVRIGSLKDTDFQLPCPYPVEWTDGPFNKLGVQVQSNMDEIVPTNFDLCLSKLDSVLQPWRGKLLTLYGKVTIVNSLVVSLFAHLFLTLPSPPQVFFQLYEKKIFNFICNNDPERVQRKVLYNTYQCGGLKLINLYAFNASLKASWIPKLYCNRDWFCAKLLSNTHVIFCKGLFPFMQLGNDDRTINRILQEQFPNTSLFFRDAISAWLAFQHNPPDFDSNSWQQQMLWCNSIFQIERKPILWQNFVESGIIFVEDLLDTNGIPMSPWCLVKLITDSILSEQ